jgi:hypothetical protein
VGKVPQLSRLRCELPHRLPARLRLDRLPLPLDAQPLAQLLNLGDQAWRERLIITASTQMLFQPPECQRQSPHGLVTLLPARPKPLELPQALAGNVQTRLHLRVRACCQQQACLLDGAFQREQRCARQTLRRGADCRHRYQGEGCRGRGDAEAPPAPPYRLAMRWSCLSL